MTDDTAPMSDEQLVSEIEQYLTGVENLVSVDFRTGVTRLIATHRRQRERTLALEGALREIKEKYGRVCIDFETCTHAACASSYGAWAVADETLRALT